VHRGPGQGDAPVRAVAVAVLLAASRVSMHGVAEMILLRTALEEMAMTAPKNRIWADGAFG